MTRIGDALVLGGVVDRGGGKDTMVAAKPRVDDGIGVLIGGCASYSARVNVLVAANQCKGVAHRKRRKGSS